MVTPQPSNLFNLTNIELDPLHMPQDEFSPTADFEKNYEGFGGGAPMVGTSNFDNDIPAEYRDDPEMWEIIKRSKLDSGPPQVEDRPDTPP